MLRSTTTRFRNELLRRLTSCELSLLELHFERVTLKPKTVLQRPGVPIEFVYFPENCLASLIARMPRGSSEAGVIGFDGMTGTPIVMGDDRQPCECVIQLPGDATRLPAKALVQAMAAKPTLRLFLLRYVQSLSTQTSFTALVNARSKLEERLARWLLMRHDRVDGDEVELTHEYLSTMLGVRRPSVTVALQILEGEGLIRAMRGVVMIRDRERLVHLARDSYGIPESEYERLVGIIAPHRTSVSSLLNATRIRPAEMKQ